MHIFLILIKFYFASKKNYDLCSTYWLLNKLLNNFLKCFNCVILKILELLFYKNLT